MSKITNKIFKQKGMKTFWTGIGTTVGGSAILFYAISLMGYGPPIALFHVFLLILFGGGLVYFVNN